MMQTITGLTAMSSVMLPMCTRSATPTEVLYVSRITMEGTVRNSARTPRQVTAMNSGISHVRGTIMERIVWSNVLQMQMGTVQRMGPLSVTQVILYTVLLRNIEIFSICKHTLSPY